MNIELKDWLNSINFTKENLLEEDLTLVKEYAPYVINRCVSGHIDTVLFANEMNMHHQLPKDMHFI
jgi:hypothetical protein